MRKKSMPYLTFLKSVVYYGYGYTINPRRQKLTYLSVQFLAGSALFIGTPGLLLTQEGLDKLYQATEIPYKESRAG